MSNNAVHLCGPFRIQKILSGAPGSRGVSFQGTIFTEYPDPSGQHTFLATGKAAEVLLAFQREHPMRSQSADEGLPNPSVLLDARGKLATYPDGAFLHVLNVHLFDTCYPISQHPFVINSLTLSGYLTIPFPQMHDRQIGQQVVDTLEATLATNHKQDGGHHTVLIPGSDARALLNHLRHNHRPDLSAQVTIGGRLVTVAGRSCILSAYISRVRTGRLRQDHLPNG